jgi:hypothetical protein
MEMDRWSVKKTDETKRKTERKKGNREDISLYRLSQNSGIPKSERCTGSLQ